MKKLIPILSVVALALGLLDAALANSAKTNPQPNGCAGPNCEITQPKHPQPNGCGGVNCEQQEPPHLPNGCPTANC